MKKSHVTLAVAHTYNLLEKIRVETPVMTSIYR